MRIALEFTRISERAARAFGQETTVLPASTEERLLVVTRGSIAVVYSGTRIWLGQTYCFNAVRLAGNLHLSLEYEPDVTDEECPPVTSSFCVLWLVSGADAVRLALEEP